MNSINPYVRHAYSEPFFEQMAKELGVSKYLVIGWWNDTVSVACDCNDRWRFTGTRREPLGEYDIGTLVGCVKDELDAYIEFFRLAVYRGLILEDAEGGGYALPCSERKRRKHRKPGWANGIRTPTPGGEANV